MTFLFLAYFIFLVIFSAYSYLALANLNKYGHVGDASRVMIILYIIVSITIVILTVILFVGSILR